MYGTDHTTELDQLPRNTYTLSVPITLIWHDYQVDLTTIRYIKAYQKGSTIYHVLSCTDHKESIELALDNDSFRALTNHIILT
jgi:hypothetical protein